MALEELETVSAAYIDNGITLYLSGTEAPDKDELTKLLAKYRIKVTGMEETEELPF